MPIRIKPEHRLRMCCLYLEDIQSIAELVSNSFTKALFSATDGIWEISAEPREAFLATIATRKSLDSFSAKGITYSSDAKRTGDPFEGKPVSQRKKVELSFNAKHALVRFEGEPEEENWFGHFMIDLKRNIRRPRLGQLGVLLTTDREAFRYCEIIIQMKPPSPFVENIKANLVSNVIWLILGGVVVLILQLLFHALGINITLPK